MKRSKPDLTSPEWFTEREHLLKFAALEDVEAKALAQAYGYEWQDVLNMRAALDMQRASFSAPSGILTISQCVEIIEENIEKGRNV